MLQQRLIGQLLYIRKPHVSGLLTMICGCHRSVSWSRRRFFCTTQNKSTTRISAGNGSSAAFMENARILWDYLRIDDPLEKSDLILVLGNSDLRTADYAAQLYREGFAPVIAVSGKEGHGTKGRWPAPEAVMFLQRLLQQNVPSSQIIMETKATNTGENIRFTQKLLRELPNFYNPTSIILVQTPFMGRRTYATFRRQWENPDTVDVKVTSPQIPMAEYTSEEAGYGSMLDLVEEMVRNMQRILHYPKQGFQITQHVPPHVMEAYRSLQAALREKNTFRDL